MFHNVVGEGNVPKGQICVIFLSGFGGRLIISSGGMLMASMGLNGAPAPFGPTCLTRTRPPPFFPMVVDVLWYGITVLGNDDSCSGRKPKRKTQDARRHNKTAEQTLQPRAESERAPNFAVNSSSSCVRYCITTGF